MSEQRMNCEEVIEHIFEYLDRELDGDLHARIDRHLEHCRDCFSRAEFEEKLRRKLREAESVQAPDRLQRRVRAMLDRF